MRANPKVLHDLAQGDSVGIKRILHFLNEILFTHKVWFSKRLRTTEKLA